VTTAAETSDTTVPETRTEATTAETTVPEPEPVTVTMTFAGDCSFGAINGCAGEYYFPTVYAQANRVSYPFDLVKNIFGSDDLTVINFEGTLTEATTQADKTWHFKGDGSYAQILPASSVEVALLSNNHSYDYFEQGFADTVSNLSGAGVGLVYESNPYVTEINGVRVVVIGDSSIIGENTTVTGNLSERVLSQIEAYKADDCIVIVDMHWGIEYTNVPTSWQTQTARSFIDAGADLVIGQHPHVLQGIEVYNGKYIVYSLGNFAFGGNCFAKYKETFLFRISFVVDPDGSREYNARVVPCFTSSSTGTSAGGVLRNNFRPIPVTGDGAEQVLSLILERSAALENGISDMGVFSDDK